MKAFLDYVAGKEVHHPLEDELDKIVQRVKRSKEWRSEYMKYEHELAAREHLAREDGREEGKNEIVLELLRANQPLSLISQVSKFSVDKISEIGRLHGVAVAK